MTQNPNPEEVAAGSHFFKLRSGRVLLLKEPFTDEEIAEASTDEGMRIMEELADVIKANQALVLTEQDTLYHRVLIRNSAGANSHLSAAVPPLNQHA